MCFDVDEKPLADYIHRLNNFGLMYEFWKDTATARSKNGTFRRPHCHLMTISSESPRISAQSLYPYKLESLRYISAADSMGLSSFKF